MKLVLSLLSFCWAFFIGLRLKLNTLLGSFEGGARIEEASVVGIGAIDALKPSQLDYERTDTLPNTAVA